MRKLFISVGLVILLSSYTGFSQAKQMSVDGQLRIRAYYKNNQDFNSTWSDKDRKILQRTRFAFIVRNNKYLQIYTQFQDSRHWGEETTTKTNLRNVDVHQAFIEYKPEGKNTYILRMGRQEINFGDGRLIGKNDWSNIGRSFDALRLIMRSVGFRCDILLAKVAHGPILADDFLYGIYYTKYFGKSLADFYFIGAKEKRGSAIPTNDRNIYNLGFRIDLNSNTINFKTEALYQMGRLGLDARANSIGISAYGLASDFKFKMGKKWYGGVNLTIGSGDDDPSSGDVKTLQIIYPNQHKFLGFLDILGWSNTKTLGIYLGLKLNEYSEMKFTFHNMEIMNKNDYWYGYDGQPYGAGIAGETSLIGREFDFSYKRTMAEYLDIQIGGALMIPGNVVVETLGKKDTPIYLYISTQVNF